ncbi:non-ribosomal peptide synthetase, partial [Snuella sedimenti]
MTYNVTKKNSDILDLLLEAKEQGITVFLEDNHVRLKVKEGIEVTEDFFKKLKEEKEHILQFLQSEAGQYQETLTTYVKNEIKPYDKNNTTKIPLSYAQERLWFIDKLQGSLAYHIHGAMRIQGKIEVALLNKAFKALIDRHESLRTVFRDEDGSGYQFIKQSDGFQLTYIPKVFKNTSINEIIDRTISKAFDLSNDYMLRATMVKENDKSHILIIVLHHIAADGWSLPIVISELETYYQSLCNRTTPQLPPLPIQYADYSIWQRNYLSGKVLEGKLAYWEEKLQNTPVLELPTDYVRSSEKLMKGALYRFYINKEIAQELNTIAKEHGATLFMTLLSAYKILLYKYTQQTDISVGTPIANREQEEIAKLVGFFINTIVLRSLLSVEDNFGALLQQVKQTCLSAYTHQDVPFERIVNHLSVERDQSRSPLFQTMFILQNTEDVDEMVLGESTVETVITEHTTSQFDLMFSAKEHSEGIAIHIEYRTALFKEETIARIAGHFEQLLKSIVKYPEIAIGSLPMLLETEKEQLLEEFNSTGLAYPTNETVVSLFSRQVSIRPQWTALVFEDRSLTYKELDERSNQVAHYLVSKGVTTNSFVPIFIERSLEMHIGILGILKAGGAYVPIDTNNPLERIEFIVNDINAEVILTDSSLSEVFSNSRKEVCCLDQLETLQLSTKAVEVKVVPAQLAYAIYTSGTTGLPKGVKNAHSGLLNRLFWMKDDVHITYGSVLIQKTPYVFDVSVWELLMPLISGCTLVIAKPEGHKDPIYLQETIKKHQVNLIHFVPSMLGVFIDATEAEQCSSLQNIVCSGEALPVQMVKDFKAKFQNIGIRNYYGPTEAAIDVTAIDLTHEDYEVAIPIGKPVANTNIYIVGNDMELSPINVPGELLIGGIQVSEGYINREVLTKEKFIASPFKEGERVYKTGDIAKWLPDGNIAYIGRKDDQVKIRGYRIELGEITAALDQIEDIKQSLVTVREDKGSKQLVAYVVSEAEVEGKSIEEQLKAKLPEYMVPKLYIQMEAFPLTINGKVDRKALPAPTGSDYQTTTYVAPTTELEQELANIWQEQLEIEQIGIHDNFFELGGDSIKIIRLISVINKKYDTNVAIASFYQSPTIENLVQLIGNTNVEDYTSVYLAIEQEIEATALSVRNSHPNQEAIENIYPMSDIQVGMVLTSEKMLDDGDIGIYHDQMVSQIGKVDITLMEKALNLLVSKHEILRTSFHLYEYVKPVQIIHKDVFINVGQHNLLDKNREEQEVYVNEFLRKEREENMFDVTKAPLWRVDLFDIGTSDSMFVFQFHHAMMDGWSDKSFRSELMETYFLLKEIPNYKPTPLAIGIKESVISDIMEARNEENIAYWKNTLQDYKRLDILTEERYDYQTSKVYTDEFLEALIAKCKEDHISLKSLLFAGYIYTLSLFSLEKDITIGVVSHRRPIAEDGDKLLGCFLNTVPFRRNMVTIGSDSWLAYIRQVETGLKELKGKDRFSFLEISKLHNESSQNNPFFDIIFNYVDFHIIDNLMGNKDYVAYTSEKETPILDIKGFERTNTFLDITMSLTGNELKVFASQAKKLKSGHSLNDVLEYLHNFLTNYLENAEGEISNRAILFEEEKIRLLETFNNTTVDYPMDKTLVDLFEVQAKKTPGSTAVVYEGEELSYAELDERSNQLARYLRDCGVRPDDLVGICLDRSLEMIIGILGILKSGGAYVPIDPDYPRERIDYMLDDGAIDLILGMESSADVLKGREDITILLLDSSWGVVSKYPTKKLSSVLSPDNLAYVIYTSGSTGRPKGVMNQHSGIVNRLLWTQSHYGLKDDDIILQKTTSSFDVSVWELLWSITCGSILVFAKPGGHKDPYYIKELIEREAITTIHFVPSMLDVFLETIDLGDCISLRRVLCSGEVLTLDQVASFKDKFKGVRIDNLYGPTEAAIEVSSWEVPLDEDLSRILIGKPVSNTRLYVLGSKGELLPQGVIGELCIGGVQVARGYLNQEELTKEKFVSNPFIEGERIYRTGDLARWLPDGELEYLGRKDDQVKIRGYRIELGEITAALDQIEGIKQSV